ncbi:type IV pilus modification protein PilV [Dyella aluminiiresistens]|uniref:type IV pilus modification protein PilV n=1 Tax=Dyella aluminiiresistens TaxID=3069105 RepID=UPI00399D33A2
MGLIEVLVAVLVLSIGFLGMAALQAMSLSTNNGAMARSMATIDSYSIFDAMRADLNNAVAGAYNKTVVVSACPASGSTLASVQLNHWCTQLENDHMGSNTQGTIDCTAATGTSTAYCTVTIKFDESYSGSSGGSTQTVVTKAML